MKKSFGKLGKKGFTLVELTVVLVIIGILAAIGIPTAMHFIKKAEYRKNEENAKTAYLAAESTLTWYRSSGEWEAFREQVMAKGVLNNTFPAGDEKEGRIYAVSVNNWDSAASASHEQAMKLLDGGVYSEDFFNAEIVIELDVESGQVYSAFYGTRCNSLTYNETTADGERCISAAGNWREPDTRKEVVLGYYSVEDVTNVVELKQVRLKVTTINLINSETLSLNWTSNSRNDNLDVKYLITFYQKDETGDKKLFTTEVELSELRGQLETVPAADAGVSTKTGMVSLEVKDPNAADASWGKWDFPLTYQQTGGSSGRFSLVLDGMMTAELAEVVEANKGDGISPSEVTRKASTSITRLGAVVPALKSPQDIYAEILVQPAYREIKGEDGTTIAMNITEYKPSSPVRSNTENTLFAKAGMKTQTGEDGLEAEITRFRHLSNIRYYDPDKAAVFTLASRNLDWTSTGVGMYGISQNATGEGGVDPDYRKVKWSSVATEDKILDFPSIPLLGEKHKLEGKKGIQAQLSNLHLGAGSMPDDEQIRKLYAGASNDKVTHYLGLICEAEGQIEELTLLDPVLRLVAGSDGAGNAGGANGGTGSGDGTSGIGGGDGTGSAGDETARVGETAADIPEAAENFDALYGVGILCGRNQGSLKNINIKTTEREHQTVLVRLKDREEEISETTGETKKPAGIGGLVGVLAGKNDDGSLEELTDAARITLSGLTTEGKVTGYLPSPEGNSGAGSANPGTGTGSANPGGAAGITAKSAEERAKDYTYGIGGIFGYAWIGKDAASGNNVQLVKCTNHGDVNGNLFTGGIVGSLKGDFATGTTDVVSIKDSFNDGLVLCLVDYEEEDNRLEGRYFGGILGYGEGAQISNGVNASQYREEFNDTKKDKLLHGHYVGGIIGYGSNSQLSGCSTRKGSYVLGSHYVGGIAGGLSNDLAEAITGGTAGIQVTTNGGYIIGDRYVGGIVGKNDGSEKTTIANCINNGVAAGYDRYIGGIVGYNGAQGVISDCASYFSDYGGFVFQVIVDKWKATGDCAGGLAGYNNGSVVFNGESQSIQVKSISSIVVGRNYVGGIIGFNDRGGEMDVDYTLIGGQIHGYGNGVGGCIGLNASSQILEEELTIQPTSVEGNYYVGGCIGANVVDIGSDTAMTKVKADNRLGGITGNAFTGGLIGYQRTYTDAQLKVELNNANPDWLNQAGGSGAAGNGSSGQGIFGKDDKLLLIAYIEGMEEAASNGDNTSNGDTASQGNESVKGTAGKLLPLLDGNNVPTEVIVSENQNTFTIGNRKNNEDRKQDEYNNIPVYSDLYTGGIVGYCERESRMHIVNARNSGNLSRGSLGEGVSLKAYLESKELDADIKELEGDDLNLAISIGGGIIGANLENQIIDHCINTGTMNGFIGLGGIVGFNAGGVFNCQLSDNFGNQGLNYIGGIAGLNVHAGGAKETADGSGSKTSTYSDVKGTTWNGFVSGTIAQCSTQENRNISGRSYVGGIAGYNLSGAEMKSNENNANVTGAGNYVGGMAGANSGSILVAENSKTNPEEYTITGNNGEGIGGIVGWNKTSGSIDVAGNDGAGNKDGEIVAVGTNVSITGKQKVGGIVGINEGKLDASRNELGEESFLVCKAKTVHAADGYAGGIIGEARRKSGTAGDGKIANAINKSINVTADRGPAGGIVAVNQQGFQLENCINLGNVNSDNGYAGGISAENYGLIVECKVGDGSREEVGITISSRGTDAIGAICAVNHGIVWKSAPEKSRKDENGNTVALSGTSRIVGGIAGLNAAGGKIGIVPVEGDTNNEKYVMNYMPGINITTAALTVGGVAGQNQSAVPGGTETTEGGEQITVEPKQAAVIQNVTAEGMAFNDFNNYQYLGGIAGENQNGALVENCIFSNGEIGQKNGTAAGNCYGGVAGINDGNLQNCRIEGITIDVQGIYTATSTSTAAEKENLASHIGGIAGKNEENGVIMGCLIAMGEDADGKSKANSITVANGMAGGVAGYNKNKIMLSGDAITDALMEKQTGADGSVSAGVMDVQTLITNANANGVNSDANYVNWNGNANVELEDQTYNGTGNMVSAGRNLQLIMSNNGNLGGITAYNAPAGEVSYCATGNWYLNNKSEAIGVGTGGIIGMNESEKNLTFLLNHAFVGRQLKAGVTNRFAGGIIGNQNNTTNSGWTIQNCVNYGTVYCKNTHYSGGILGQWTGTGGNIEKCYNYGNLQTTHGEGWVGASGGIVAQLYHAYENNEYNIIGCGNYGNIYGQRGRNVTNEPPENNKPNCANDSAGILGNVTAYRVEDENNAQRFTINVIDCVNGPGVEIYSGSMASGIVGFFSCDNPNTDSISKSTANITLNIERCRNYASRLLGLQFVGGIFGDRYGAKGSSKTTLKYCFSLDYDQYEYLKSNDSQPFPIVSCKNAPPANPDSINNGDGNIVYNFFLGNRDNINSFPGATISHNVNNRDRLQKVNSNWVYSFVRDGIRYFVYISERNYNATYTIANWTIEGKQFGDKIISGYGAEIGYVLFTIEGNDRDRYGDMAPIVAKDSGFDTYVREFCFTQAGLLLAPEKAVLSKTDDGQFTLEVDAPAYAADAGNIEYVATLWRKAEDGTETQINVSEMENPADSGIMVDSDTNTFLFDSETCTFGLSNDAIGQSGELFVRLIAREKDNPDMKSTEVESNSVPLGSVLPEPKLRIELVAGTTGTGGAGYEYRFRLANPNAYKDYSDLKAHVKLMDGTELTFDINGTNDTANYSLAADSLQQLVVWVAKPGATPGAGMSSAEVSVPVYLPCYTPPIAVKGNGVTQPSYTVSGTSLKDLAVTVTLTGPGGSVTTPPIYRAELVGTWTGTDGTKHENYVFQTADILTVASGEVKAVFTDFEDSVDLPEEFAGAEDIKVRVWYAQSGLGPVYTYYMDLSNGETANTRTKETIDGKEEDGPQWQDAYTRVLEDNTFENYRWESGKLFEWLPAPVLMTVADGKSLTPEIDSNNGHLKYTFKWDEDITTNNNDYIVTLTGTVIDEAGNKGNPVSIVTDREVSGGTLTLDAEDWPYQEVELSVTRKGYTDGATGTIYIGRTSTETYSVKKRLPRPEQPKVTNPDVNELSYELEWSPVTPEIGPDASQQNIGCTSYEIYIRPVMPSVPANPNEEMRKTVKVWNDDGTPNVTPEGVYRELIDLEDYAGKQILISIKAMAADDDEVYVHSVDGITYELTVPERIPTPTIKEWEKNWKHEPDKIIDPDNPDSPSNIYETKSIEEFEEGGENGLKVTLTADTDSIPPGGSSYLTKAYVFETAADAGAAQQALINKDEAALNLALEKLVAYYPLLNAENPWIPAGMEPEGGSQDKFSHTLTGLSAEYAGKYILFSARISSGGGKVSSEWVVQQGTNPDAFIWQLPYVKLPTPEVSVENGNREVEVTFTVNPDFGTTSSVSLDDLEEMEEDSSANGIPVPGEEVNGAENGNAGSIGDTGNSADAGNSGDIGSAGDAGNGGDIGNAGEAGTAGNGGDTGSSEAAGEAGNAGNGGNTGSAETSGNAGEAGTTGTNGTTGNNENTGENADSSESGTAGGNANAAAGTTENTGNAGNADATPESTGNTDIVRAKTRTYAANTAAGSKASTVEGNGLARRNTLMAAERMSGGFAASEMIYRMGSSVANNIAFMAAAANTGSIDGSRGNAAAQPADDSTEPQPENIITQPTDDGMQSTDATNSTVDGTGLQITSQELQANGIAPQADDVQMDETWTAENTVLSWNSVEYADAYYFILTDDGAADGSGNAMTAEFKIVETKNETDPSATTVTVFGKDAAGSNQWVEITEITEPDLSAGIDLDLSQDGATFQTYHKVVSGMYAVDSSTTIPYEVDLKTILSITMQDGVLFTYTLSLPDSNSLNPPANSAYALEGNSIVNSNSDKLRFTDSVRIWSDMSVNDDADNTKWSEAYVKSVEYVAEFNN